MLRFESALALARQQGARSLQLRAATSLARYWTKTGQVQRALAQLAPLYASFHEGLRTADLLRAQLLLDESLAFPDVLRVRQDGPHA